MANSELVNVFFNIKVKLKYLEILFNTICIYISI